MLCTPLIGCQYFNQHENGNPQDQLDEFEHTTYEQERDLPNKQPQLEGGSERDVREPHPVSNNILQKEFPNALFLNGSPSTNQVALTFDDGPDIRFTPQVFDVLAKHDVKATFFLIGARAKEHNEITKRIHDEGHPIGNHTYWHPNLPKEGLGRLHWELTQTEQVIEDITGINLVYLLTLIRMNFIK